MSAYLHLQCAAFLDWPVNRVDYLNVWICYSGRSVKMRLANPAAKWRNCRMRGLLVQLVYES